MSSCAEDLPYWKTGTSDPQRWVDRAIIEIERAGGTVLGEGFGRDQSRAAFMLRFAIGDDTFRVVWPVLESKYSGEDLKPAFLGAARRQAATMLYHDVKACCVKARVLGARAAFFAHLEVGGGMVASQLTGDLTAEFPRLLGSGTVDAEVIE